VDLRPGTYEISFSLTGFNSVRREGIDLTTGFTAPVSVELRVGAIEETLTVKGASPIVDIRNTQSQKVLSREVLDAVPTGQSLHGYTSLTLGASISGADVGGNKSEAVVTMSIHGNRGSDQKLFMDGMNFNQLNAQGSGTSRYFFVNQLFAQEVTLESGGMGESTAGGVQLNVVPKEGGSTFKGTIMGNYTGPRFQSGNLTDELRARGLTGTNKIRRIYDFGGGFGGPIKKDRLHFFTAHRWWGASEYVPSNFFQRDASHALLYAGPESTGVHRLVQSGQQYPTNVAGDGETQNHRIV